MNKPEFTVPYNFIPLMRQKSEAYPDQGNCSGVIEYTLLTKTPLFIPNSSNDHAFPQHCHDPEHKSYDFFSYDDLSDVEDCEPHPHTPVIPGSEMRGVLRSTYEILTNSCMSSLNDKTQMSKRTMESFKPGLIIRNEDGTFDLCKAELCIARFVQENSLKDDERTYTRSSNIHTKSFIQDNLSEGQRVSFDYKKRGSKVTPLARNVEPYNPDKEKDNGYIIKGNDFDRKHCLHILCDLGEDPILKDIDLSVLEKVLKEYKNNGYPYTEYQKEFNVFKTGNGNVCFPVYYSIPGENRNENYNEADKKILMLSPAQKTREIYNLKLNDLVGTYGTCKDKEHLCPACDLFGTVIEDNGYAKASKIRVTDLSFDEHQDHPYDIVKNLSVLGSPKRNNMEFYLKRPDNAYFWTYEYFVDVNGNLHRQKAQINGRKFYWHHVPDPMRAYLSDEENTNLNVTVRPVRKGIHFKGKIYFNHISEKQLKQLIWILNCGDRGDIQNHTHGLKMGMAKPLGFGSVSVQVNTVKLRSIVVDKKQQTILNEDKDYSCSSDDVVFTGNAELVKNLNNFRKASSFDALKGRTVAYPFSEKGSEGFTWYTWNHGSRDVRWKSETKRFVQEKGMPTNRNSMAYVYYMQAMNPDLAETGTHSERKQIEQQNNFSHKDSGYWNHDAKDHKKIYDDGKKQYHKHNKRKDWKH